MLRISILALVFFALFNPVRCRAQEAETPETASLETAREQGCLYYQRSHYNQAVKWLEAGYQKPGGKEDFKLLLCLAEANRKVGRLQRAIELTKEDLPRVIAADPVQKTEREGKAGKTLAFAALFGAATFKLADPAATPRGRIFFEAKTGIINKEKRQLFESVQVDFRMRDVRLPITVYLPYGDYTANKVPFSLVDGDPLPTVEIFLATDPASLPEPDEGVSTWWYVGGGAVAVGLGVAYFLLTPADEPAPERRTRIGFSN